MKVDGLWGEHLRWNPFAAGETSGGHNMQWTAVIRCRVSEDDGHTWGPVETVEEPVAIPIEILGLGGTDPVGMPFTFGTPVAEGRATAPRRCVLRCGGQESPAQTRVHARWVLVDVPCPTALGESRDAAWAGG